MSFLAAWMELEIVILHEVRENEVSYSVTFMWKLKHTHIHTHTHTMEYYSCIRRNETLPFATI